MAGLLDSLQDALYTTPKAYWGDKAKTLASLLSDSATAGAGAYGSASQPLKPEYAKTLAGLLADFTPVVGDVKSAYDGYQAAREGDYLGAGFGALGALPLVPNIGLLGHMGHAKKGGQIGVNGEFYEGGKFLPSTDAPKKAPSKFPKGGKVEVAPWVYDVRPADDLQPLWNQFRDGIGAGTVRVPKGTPLDQIPAEKREIPSQFLAYTFPDGVGAAEFVDKKHKAVDAWNAGARYVGADGVFYKADGTPL